MSLFSRTSLALVLVLAAAAALAAGPSGAARVHAAGHCHLSAHAQRHLGATYVRNLRVRHTSCRTGRRVAKAFYKCRHHHGGANGHCGHKVKHFRCKENRGQASPVQYNSSVSCKRGGKRVKFGYTQNT